MFSNHQGGYRQDSATHLKIFIGADHRGYQFKNKIVQNLRRRKYAVVDMGTDADEVPCDYPKISYKVAGQVAKTKDSRGILVCMSGIGHSIAANKVPGAYAALCYNKNAAVLSREHNNSNILVLGARFVPASQMNAIITAWLKTPFAGGRHLRRVKQIKTIEKNFLSSGKSNKELWKQ